MTSIPVLPRRGLYALTPDNPTDDALLVARVVAAIEGGAALVQYRDKSASADERRRRATALVSACHRRGVPLVVNDAVELAADIGAAGVHIGRDDGDIDAARALLGAARIIGVSCYDSLELARCYLSATKPHARPCPIAVLQQAAAELPVPIVAIGGITAENAEALLSAGASMLAVIGALFDKPDVTAAARAFAAPLSHIHRF